MKMDAVRWWNGGGGRERATGTRDGPTKAWDQFRTYVISMRTVGGPRTQGASQWAVEASRSVCMAID